MDKVGRDKRPTIRRRLALAKHALLQAWNKDQAEVNKEPSGYNWGCIVGVIGAVLVWALMLYGFVVR